MTDSIRRLHRAVVATRDGVNPSPRTAKLFAKGRGFVAKKVAEEAVEVALDGVRGDVPGTIRESADLIYNLIVLWAELGIEPEEVWSEMRRREQMLGIAEKMPKRRAAEAQARSGTRQLPLELAGEAPPPGVRRR